MSDKSYPLGDEAFGNAGVNWLADTIEVLLLSSAYTYSDAHEFESDLAGIITRGTLAGKTNVGGVLDGDDQAFANPGTNVASVVLLKQTGSAATARLLLYFDEGLGLPFAVTGNGIVIVWPNAATYKIYRIGGQRP